MNANLFPEEDGATPLTHEETLGLIPSYITQRGELNEAEQVNITTGESWAFSRPRDVLEVDFLCELHRRMFGQVWRWAGKYSRERNRRLGLDQYQIPTALYALVDEVRGWIAFQSYLPDEIALRFHHRLTQIHPFANGNGRFSRTAADLLITQLGNERFSWGRISLVDASTTRRIYIDSLRSADAHEHAPLLAFARS